MNTPTQDMTTRLGVFVSVYDLEDITRGYDSYVDYQYIPTAAPGLGEHAKEYTGKEIQDILTGASAFGKHLVFVDISPAHTLEEYANKGQEIRQEKEEQSRIRYERAKKAQATKKANEEKKKREMLEKLKKELGEE